MSVAAPGPPFEISGYRILRKLGEGGMATVYLAQQIASAREVAIKVLAAERTPNEEWVKRFEQEARLIAGLDHPHIVNIYEVGRTASGRLYYSMPHLPNGDLSTRRWTDEQPRIVATMRAICQALAYAHERGVVHRDVKPENVLFDKLDRPLLADFGIAFASRPRDMRVTRENTMLGSTAYMSPEQARGQAIDRRSDLYSLGVLCYELVTGDLPFHGPDAFAVALAHIEDTVPCLPPTRRHWQALIDKALTKDPNERFQNAGEFIAALDAVQTQLDGGRARARRLMRAMSRRLLVAAAALLAAAAIAAWWLLHEPGPVHAKSSPATSAATTSAPRPNV